MQSCCGNFLFLCFLLFPFFFFIVFLLAEALSFSLSWFCVLKVMVRSKCYFSILLSGFIWFFVAAWPVACGFSTYPPYPAYSMSISECACPSVDFDMLLTCLLLWLL